MTTNKKPELKQSAHKICAHLADTIKATIDELALRHDLPMEEIQQAAVLCLPSISALFTSAVGSKRQQLDGARFGQGDISHTGGQSNVIPEVKPRAGVVRFLHGEDGK